MNLEYYQTLYQNSMQRVKEVKKNFSRCSVYRVGAALCMCIFFIAGYTRKFNLDYLLGAAAGLVFLILVRWHNRIEAEISYHSERAAVAKAYIGRFEDGWKESKENGSEYLLEDFPPAKDLDLFGTNSLYQYICAAGTPFGKACLADWLRHPQNDPAVITKRQQAVHELVAKQDFSITFQAIARAELKERSKDSGMAMQQFLESTRQSGFRPLAMHMLCCLLPVVTWLMLVLSFAGIDKETSGECFMALISLQLLITLAGAFWNDKLLKPVYRFNRRVKPYQKLIAAVEQEEFKSAYMVKLQKRLLQDKSAKEALAELGKISEAISARYNLIAFFVYNSLFLYDFHCAWCYLRWRKKYQNKMEDWFKTVGEVEALISLGVLCQVKTVYTFPDIHIDPKPHLAVKNLKHPLICDAKAVGNDFDLHHHTCMITGSNMSGKTTFLRSIGVNLMLAYAGGPVAAADFSAGIMTVCTSMRITDSVSDGISTFYAELLRIKGMIDESQKAMPMITLIDEIYKGTNSKDRIIGAAETIKRLSRPNVLTILTTHDLELCDLEKDAKTDLVNYHFSEHYTEHEILFDYKMKKGPCQSTNAQYLLRMVGILK